MRLSNSCKTGTQLFQRKIHVVLDSAQGYSKALADFFVGKIVYIAHGKYFPAARRKLCHGFRNNISKVCVEYAADNRIAIRRPAVAQNAQHAVFILIIKKMHAAGAFEVVDAAVVHGAEQVGLEFSWVVSERAAVLPEAEQNILNHVFCPGGFYSGEEKACIRDE